MLRRARLQNSAEFRFVYEHGRRYDGRLFTIFVLNNGTGQHRLGITASRKMSKSAVERNRARRLVREAFRLCHSELDHLQGRYDWVFNARRSLLSVKVDAVISELRVITSRVLAQERVAGGLADVREQ